MKKTPGPVLPLRQHDPKRNAPASVAHGLAFRPYLGWNGKYSRP